MAKQREHLKRVGERRAVVEGDLAAEFRLPPKKMGDGVISVRMTPADYEWLRSYGKEHERSMGTVARAMIEHMIKALR